MHNDTGKQYKRRNRINWLVWIFLNAWTCDYTKLNAYYYELLSTMVRVGVKVRFSVWIELNWKWIWIVYCHEVMKSAWYSHTDPGGTEGWVALVVWMVSGSGHAHIFVILSVVVVPYPIITRGAQTALQSLKQWRNGRTGHRLWMRDDGWTYAYRRCRPSDGSTGHGTYTEQTVAWTQWRPRRQTGEG